MLKLDEAQDLADALVDLIGRDMVLVEPVGHVVAHGERVKQGTLLKDHADMVAQGEHGFILEGAQVLPEDADGAGIRTDEPVGQLEQYAFAHARRAQDDAGFAAAELKRDVVENRVIA